jgi:hypothetical protein
VTDLLSPEDTGEITRIDTGDDTQNLAGHTAFLDLPSYRRPDATGEIPVVDAWGPDAPPPPPLPQPSPNPPPKPAADLAAAQPLFPLERVVDYTTPSGPSTPPPVPRPLPPLRPAVPRKPALTRLAYKPKHRAPRVPSPLRGLAKFTAVVVLAATVLWWVIS